ncbi:hypothetical protein [Nonomuraea sediminis]|uniref:hypothetical protein n=1 Tax=Nonomuraea sediminis TaxID=2835864 RepID=UPI001BDBE825|nr:hypothetical protein [Nonomuraea sediminis]
MDPVAAAMIILAAFTLILAAAGAGLYRRVRELELATYQGVGLNVAQSDPTGTLAELAAPGRMTVAVKINRQCSICDELVATIRRIAPSLEGEVQLAIVSDDPKFAKPVPANVRVITRPEAWRAINLPYVPAAVVIDEGGVVVHSAPAGSSAVLEEIIHRVAISGEESRREADEVTS